MHVLLSGFFFFSLSLHEEYCEPIQFPSQESFENLTFAEQWKSQKLNSFPPNFLVGCLSSPLCFFVFLALCPNVGSGWQLWIFCIHTKHTKGPDKGRINNQAT